MERKQTIITRVISPDTPKDVVGEQLMSMYKELITHKAWMSEGEPYRFILIRDASEESSGKIVLGITIESQKSVDCILKSLEEFPDPNVSIQVLNSEIMVTDKVYERRLQ